jgi:hypothetical protein
MKLFLLALPSFPSSDKSPSDAQIRMESERAFIITGIFLELVYPQDWLSIPAFMEVKFLDLNLN